MKRFLISLCLSLLIFSLVACSGASSSSSGTIDEIFCMTAAQTQVQKIVPDAKFSNDTGEWAIVDLGDGNVSIGTRIVDGDHVNLIIEPLDNSKYAVHFLEIGDTVHIDDGTIEN